MTIPKVKQQKKQIILKHFKYAQNLFQFFLKLSQFITNFIQILNICKLKLRKECNLLEMSIG
nr:MAG TPA: hypothetical protein [Caudoviricetes sp.]